MSGTTEIVCIQVQCEAGYIHVPVGFKCEASIPKGEIGFLEGFKHRASHSFQYLAEYTHTSEAGVYTG